MFRKCITVVIALVALTIPAGAKTEWNVDNYFYNPDGCPITVTELQSHWQEYRAPVYNYYGMRLKKELLPGIWCKVNFEVPKIKDESKEILGIKFGLWYFNAFDELLGVYKAYATQEGKKVYIPGKKYKAEWLTNQDDNLGPTHCRTIVFPYQVRFVDGTWWTADFQPIFDWFLDTMDWGEFKYEDLFPDKVFGSEEEAEKTA